MTENAPAYEVEQPQTTIMVAPVVSTEAWAMRRKQFAEFVNTQLRTGVDYGRVPGVDKDGLWKPGAEKILQLYGVAPAPDKIEDFLDYASGNRDVTVTMGGYTINGGLKIGTGVGSCSTRESKYAFRWKYWYGSTTPPDGEGWESFYDKKERRNKWRLRIANRDLPDQWNTVLKMAKKRAMVDLALTISGASERFTQDIEDFGDGQSGGDDNGDKKAEATQPKQPAPAAKAPAKQTGHDDPPPPEEPPIDGEYKVEPKATPTNGGAAKAAAEDPGKWDAIPISEDGFRVPDWFSSESSNMLAARGVKVTFGKYSGKPLGEIDDDDHTYIAWLTSDKFEAKDEGRVKLKRAATYLRSWRKWSEWRAMQEHAMPVGIEHAPATLLQGDIAQSQEPIGL